MEELWLGNFKYTRLTNEDSPSLILGFLPVCTEEDWFTMWDCKGRSPDLSFGTEMGSLSHCILFLKFGGWLLKTYISTCKLQNQPHSKIFLQINLNFRGLKVESSTTLQLGLGQSLKFTFEGSLSNIQHFDASCSFQFKSHLWPDFMFQIAHQAKSN